MSEVLYLSSSLKVNGWSITMPHISSWKALGQEALVEINSAIDFNNILQWAADEIMHDAKQDPAD